MRNCSNKAQEIAQADRDIRNLETALEVIEKYSYLMINDFEINPKRIQSFFNRTKLELKDERNTLKNEKYLEAVKSNFFRGDFKVSENNITKVLKNEELRNMLYNAYIKQRNEAQKLFSGIPANEEPTNKMLRQFCLNS
jgi:hypothetical protein